MFVGGCGHIKKRRYEKMAGGCCEKLASVQIDGCRAGRDKETKSRVVARALLSACLYLKRRRGAVGTIPRGRRLLRGKAARSDISFSRIDSHHIYRLSGYFERIILRIHSNQLLSSGSMCFCSQNMIAFAR